MQATSSAAVSTDRLAPAAFGRLERAARDSAAATAQVVTAAYNAERHLVGDASAHQNGAAIRVNGERSRPLFVVAAAEAGGRVPPLVAAIKESQSITSGDEGAESSSSSAAAAAAQYRAHSRLIRASQALVVPATRLVDASRTSLADVDDPYAAQNLHSASGQLSTNLAELRVALNNAQQIAYEHALEHTDDLINELDAELQVRNRQRLCFSSFFSRQATTREHAHLRAPPVAVDERAEASLHNAARNVTSTLAQLVAASHSNTADRQHIGASTVDAADALRSFVGGIRPLAPAMAPDVDR